MKALWIHRRFLTQCWIKHFTTNPGAAVTESENLISSTTQTFLAEELQFARSFLNITDGFYDTHDQAQHAASYILWTLKVSGIVFFYKTLVALYNFCRTLGLCPFYNLPVFSYLQFALSQESMHEEIFSELRDLKPLLLKTCAVNSLGWETMLP